MRRIVSICLVVLMVQGCHLGPRYELPRSQVPEGWKGDTAEGGALVEFWWEVFGDDLLTELEKRLMDSNPDLYSAMERVAEARATAGVAKAELYPQASLQPSYNDIGELYELYGVPKGIFPALKTIVRVHEMTYELPLNMYYELDLWQRNRGTYNAAKMNAQARQEAYRATLLMLTSDLASNYYNARTLDTQIVILEKIVGAYRELLRLRQLRYLAGVDSYLAVLDAILQYENSEAKYEDAIGQRISFENAIATLIGTPASDFNLAKAVLAGEPPSIPAGLPSELLIRRPDIAEAERTMAAEHALIGVAYSSFYPNLTLTGALGFLSPELNKFISWAGHLWQWGAKIFETVFDGGRNSSVLEAAKALFQEGVGAYQKTVLNAFQEVEDALTNLEQEAKQSEDLLQAYESTKESLGLFEKRFETGMANQLDVLTCLLTACSAEQSFVNVLGLRYQATIQLIKAIGGSWECNAPLEPPEQMAEPSPG